MYDKSDSAIIARKACDKRASPNNEELRAARVMESALKSIDGD
jgi:hypothetical protein